MNKCLKIVFTGDFPEGFLHNFVQKHAKKFNLEGTVQYIEDNVVRIIACGAKDDIDSFVDVLHKGPSGNSLDDVEIEPMPKDKDYRGVFRVIE